MGKIVKGLLVAAVFIGASFIPGIGQAVQASLLAAGVSTALSTVAMAAFAPKMPKTQLSRLNVSLDPSTPRKMVFGTTAMPLDIRYHEASGTNQEYIDYIIALAAHKIKSVDAIWFEDKQAWTLAGGVTSRYSGYLTVNVRLEGTSANYIPINGGTKWGSDDRLTGCAYIHLRVKRTGNTDKAESPLVNGLPSRVTVIGEGGHLYDPRKDSTVPGGSGTHRANDQSTWGTYTDPDDVDNPVLQLLWYLIGWKINGKLSVGCGVPISRIDLPSFITAANICDENITLAIGGTQKRYRASGTASDSDDRMEIINTFLASMNGTLRDNEGKLTLTVMKNDLADYVLTFDENDVLDAFEWNQTRGLDTGFNVARGRYVDPSNNSLYQLTEYPEVRLASPDGIDRVLSLDLAFVEDGRRAQRLAKQILQRNQYRGTFSAVFTAKALGCQVGDVVRLTFSPLGWTNKLFRVISQQIDFSGQVPLTLVEENAAIYAWDAEDKAPIEATAPTVYDPLNHPFILAIGEVEGTRNSVVHLYQRTATDVAPSVDTTGSSTYDFTANTITGQPSGWTVSIPDTSAGEYLWVIQSVAESKTTTATIANTNWSSPVLFAENGEAGAPGLPATSGYLTNESVLLFAYANGNIVSYDKAVGQFVIVSGNTDISTNFTLSIPSGGNPQGLTVSLLNQSYAVTGGFDANEDTANLTIRATGSGLYSGVTIDKVFSLSKAKGGYEIVATLPTTNNFEGRVVFLTTDDKLYRYNGTVWTAAVPAADISGTITDTQIADDAITSPKIAANAVTATEIAANAITTDKLNAGAVTAAKLASSELITLSAQIGSAVVTNAKIADAAISTAKIADAAISTAKIGDLQVSTLKIANQAVTIPVSSYTSGSITGGGSETIVQSATIVSTGAPILVLGSVTAYGKGADGYNPTSPVQVRVYRNTTLIAIQYGGVGTFALSEGGQGVAVSSYANIAFSLTDTPGAGSVTYYIKCVDASSYSQRSLALLETKK